MDRERADCLAHDSLAAARWAGLGLGTALLAAPGIGTAAGLGADRHLVRVAGAVDLGLCLLFGGQSARWMVGRVIGNAIIGAVRITAIKAGAARRVCAIGCLRRWRV